MFNEIYKKVDVPQIEIIARKKGMGIIEDIKNNSRFEKLHHIRSAKKNELCPLSIAMEYFYGNEVFFNSEVFKDLDFFKETISFETGTNDSCSNHFLMAKRVNAVHDSNNIKSSVLI